MKQGRHESDGRLHRAGGGAASGVQHYTAFGEVRSRGGEMPTVYQYTGQLSQMEEVGLYHYGARWFDPAGAHFTQADKLVPGVGNPQSWDRYAYVNDNPINYTDPTGHMQVLPDDGGLDSDVIKNHLEEVYDWNAEGDFNTEQLFSIWDVATELRLYVSKQVGHDGLEWMETYLSGTTFTIDSFITKKLGASITPDHKTIHLIGGFEVVPWEQGVVGHVLHEIGHILDNRLANNIDRYKAGISPLSAVFIGGGPADSLYAFMGGQPTGMFKYHGGVSFTDPSNAFVRYLYGNNSPADYFAHTLAISIIDYEAVPTQAAMWMSSFVSLLP